ncbi:MAG TPA: HAD hydrolase family protein [Candidatus Paceibacterota bacterium]|nr:HAD hydrolase family protein [Verrucomicrobiota bacterium]HSA09639.1 HAD hydrolase family protein [Candidatus Paceibacterota bacterium]
MPARRTEHRTARARGRRPASLDAALRRIRLLLCDVDGVLTDGAVFIGGPEETKRFSIRDGLGLVIARREGLKIGWISGRASAATARRARELKIDFLRQQKGGKVYVVDRLLAQTGFRWDEVCYIGDDIVDLGVLKRAGVAVAVANGVAEAGAAADYVTRADGGHGAVREVVELILKAQGKWEHIVAAHAA